MKLARTLLLPLVSVLLAAGCAVSEAPTDSASSEVVATPQPDTQHFANVSKAEQDATIARFIAKNPDFPLGTSQVNELTGGIRVVNRNAPLGSRVTQTSAEVVAKATAFLQKNAAELALTASDIATANVEAKPYPFESGNFPWTVSFNRITATPGYEGFDTVDHYVSVSVDFQKDGTIGRIYNGTSFFPGLRVSTTPALAENSSEVLENIIGTELVWRDESFVPRPDIHLGLATEADVVSKRPVLNLRYDATGFTLTLAYEVVVKRDSFMWKFTVHSTTGAVLKKEQTYDF